MLIYLLILVVQVAVLILIACVLHFLFRRRPSVQYFVWLAAIVSVGLAIPLQSQIPSLDMEIPVAEAKPLSAAPIELSNTSVETELLSMPSLTGELADVEAIPAPESESLVASMPPKSVKASAGSPMTVWQWVAVAYFAVIAALLLRLAIGYQSLNRLANSAANAKLSLEACEDSLNAVVEQTSSCRKVRVMLSDEIQVPMAFGLWSPIVLLPSCFATWSKEAQQAVLLHEFSHIKRFDAFWDLAARLVAIAYWFHPAIHFAMLRLRQTRERATDQLVLDHGVSPTVYAQQLLEVATQTSRLRQPAMYMSCQSDIKYRIGMILDMSDQKPMTNFWLRFIHLKLSVAFVVLASFSIQVSVVPSDAKNEPTSDDKEAPRKVQADVVGDTFYERIEQVTPRESHYHSNKKIFISGRVVGPDGNPESDAIVVLRDGSTMIVPGDGAINDIVGKTRTDENGFYRIDNVSLPVGRRHAYGVLAVAKGSVGFSQSAKLFKNSRRSIDNVDVELRRTVDVIGRVVDPDGNAVEKVKVRITHFSHSKNPQVTFGDRLMSPRSDTDSNGEFCLKGIPEAMIVGLEFDHPDFALGYEKLRTTKEHSRFDESVVGRKEEVKENGGVFKLEKGTLVSGVVVDVDSKPIENLRVSSWQRSSVTDSDGRFSFRARDSYFELSGRGLSIYSKEDRSSMTHPVDFDELKNGVPVVLTYVKPAKVFGQIVSQHSGVPLAGVEVTFRTNGDSTYRSVVTDEEGRFERAIISGVSQVSLASNNSLLNLEMAKGTGFKAGTIDDLLSQQTIGSVNLKSGESRELRIYVPCREQAKAKVVDSDGQPIQGAEVGFCDSSGGGFNVEAVSDADGNASFDSIIEEPNWANFLLARYVTKEQQVFWAEADTNESSVLYSMKLEPSTLMTGKVSVDGEPIAGVDVRVFKDNGDRPKQLISTVRTGKRGEFSTPVPSRRFDGRRAKYRIEVASAKIPNDKIRFAVNKALLVGGKLNADVDLIKGDGEIAGVVVNSTGDPVANSLVEVQHLMTRHPKRKEIHPNRLFESTSQYTDSEGRFEIGGLPEGYEAIVVAGVGSAMRGASVISVGNQLAKVLVTDGEESMLDDRRRFR